MKLREIREVDMTYILGIETSCDETSAAIVEDGRHVKSNIIYSQIPIHREFGGVVPEIASRNHIIKIREIVSKAIAEAGITKRDLDAVAVTMGPGLVGSLLVGVNYAKALSYSLGIPLIGVNHLDGHISSNYIAFEDLEPPFIALIVSGGHTHFYNVKDYGDYEAIGRTRDDALGEAFDKVARVLNLKYPGGPEIEKLAKNGNNSIKFPTVLLEKDSLDFSFSGIKSNVINFSRNNEFKKEDLACSFQECVFEIVRQKILRASLQTGMNKIVVAGGVASNSRLREVLDTLDLDIKYPPLSLCTDNGAMIAASAYHKFLKKEYEDLSLNAVANFCL